MARVLKAIDWKQGQQCAEAIANIKRVLRGNDVQAVALVVVRGQGVGTLYGGPDDGPGLMYALRSGVANLGYRLDKAENERAEQE